MTHCSTWLNMTLSLQVCGQVIEDRIRRVLEARPDRGCDICRNWGIQVVIFRGNNRNRRRGFHTHVLRNICRSSKASASVGLTKKVSMIPSS